MMNGWGSGSGSGIGCGSGGNLTCKSHIWPGRQSIVSIYLVFPSFLQRVGAIQRLASNVAVMEDAVMVPSRLMGLNSDDVRDVVVPDEATDKLIDHGTGLKLDMFRGVTFEREMLSVDPVLIVVLR